MYVSHDALADAMYVSLRLPEGGIPTPSPCTVAPSLHRQAGNVYAYEFLFVSRGVSLDGIDPEDADRIRKAVRTAIKSPAHRRLTAPLFACSIYSARASSQDGDSSEQSESEEKYAELSLRLLRQAQDEFDKGDGRPPRRRGARQRTP